MKLTLFSILCALFGIASNAWRNNLDATIWAGIALAWMILVLMKELTE